MATSPSYYDQICKIVEALIPDQAPEPKFTIMAQLERSVLFEAMEEKKAKLETFRAQETEFRAILVSAYAALAYEAEIAGHRTGTRQWEEGCTLQAEYERLNEALDAHTDCLHEIDYLERSIADDQQDLDNVSLWEQVGGAQ